MQRSFNPRRSARLDWAILMTEATRGWRLLMWRAVKAWLEMGL